MVVPVVLQIGHYTLCPVNLRNSRLLRLGLSHRPHVESIGGGVLHRIPSEIHRLVRNRVVIRRGHGRKLAQGGRLDSEVEINNRIATVSRRQSESGSRILRGADLKNRIHITIRQLVVTNGERFVSENGAINGEMQCHHGVTTVGEFECLCIVTAPIVRLLIPSIADTSRVSELMIDSDAITDRHAIEVRLIASKVHRVALDTRRAVKVEAVQHGGIVAGIGTYRTVLEMPVRIGRIVGGACRCGTVHKQWQVDVVEDNDTVAQTTAFHCRERNYRVSGNIGGFPVFLVAPHNAVGQRGAVVPVNTGTVRVGGIAYYCRVDDGTSTADSAATAI